ncbi:MAG: hypothetical protein EXR99_11335 [Gemmataceae bacterium]|nr:hypothetical protein [Gemmataceae bacterium]
MIASKPSWLAPLITVAIAFAYLGYAASPKADPADGFHFQEFASLPVVDGGRVKPMDTFARVSLMVINDGVQSYQDEKKVSQPAVKWLLEVMTSRFVENPVAENLKVFRIENDQLLGFLGLSQRPGLRYSINEIASKFKVLEERAIAAERKDPDKLDALDKSVIQLAKHLQIHIDIATHRAPLLIPANGDWKPFMQAAMESRAEERPDPAVNSFGKILMAFGDGKPKEFNAALADYQSQIEGKIPPQQRISGLEVSFNHFSPLSQCIYLYVVVFLLTCVGWVSWRESLNSAAFWLAVATFMLHTCALSVRMYMQGRPPVTNLYSSAVFIGWGCVLGALVLEYLYANGIGNLKAAITGALTLLIANHLAGEGDTLEMMQAVLDTNFWLATHVTCITLGYTATFLAGFLGIFYILRGTFTPFQTPEAGKSLIRMTYGVLCFAIFFSFVGTVLGGIWADQSWGRFWGWDPKENGAMLIVIWNALILHARWGGLARDRGIALLAVVGNMVTGWSWFGTNQLGVGLHAYGFNDTLANGLTWFWASQLGVLALGLIPTRNWWSNQVQTAEAGKQIKPGMRKA